MDFFSFSFKHSSPQSSTFYHPDRMAKCHLQRFIFSSFSPRLTPPSSTSVALLRHLPPYPLVHLNLSTDTPFTARPESHLLLLYKAFPGPLPGVTFLPLNTPQVFMHMTLGTRTFTFCTHLSPREANISRIAVCLAHLLSPVRLGIEPGAEVFTWEWDRGTERRGRRGRRKESLLDAPQQLDLVELEGMRNWEFLPFGLREWEMGYSFLLDSWHLSWTEHKLLFKLCVCQGLGDSVASCVWK